MAIYARLLENVNESLVISAFFGQKRAFVATALAAPQ
jgi:hypothetical protein